VNDERFEAFEQDTARGFSFGVDSCVCSGKQQQACATASTKVGSASVQASRRAVAAILQSSALATVLQFTTFSPFLQHTAIPSVLQFATFESI
jgi:hypothetical protein